MKLRFSTPRAILLLLTIALSLTFVNSGFADTTRDLQNSVHRLKIWLGQGDRADGWRDFLDLNAVETQAAKGPRADVAKLIELHQRFSSGSAGLELAPFTDVKYSLQAQINRLSNRRTSGDIQTEISIARDSYKQISVDSLEYRRDRAVYDLEVLKLFYKSHLYSRNRAGVYHDLAIDGVVDVLKEINFELPPDISVGKLNEKLRAMKDDMETVEQEFDELPEMEDIDDLDSPVAPQPDDSDDDAIEIQPPGISATGKSKSTNTKQENDEVEEDFSNEDGDAPSEDLSSDDEPQKDPAPKDAGEESLTDSQKQTQDEKKRINENIRQRQKQINDKLAGMEKEYDELKTLRDKVREQDGDRQKRRVDTWRGLSKAAERFVKVNTDRNDRYFTSAYDSFSKFALLYFYGTDDNLQEEFNEVLDRLAKEIVIIENPSERDASALVADAIGWLDATELAPEVVLLVKEKYSQPNIKASVSGQLLAQLGTRPVSDARAVNEQLFGRLMRGYAHTNGNVNVELIDDPNQARLSIRLQGNVASQTYTRAGRITAYGGANGVFDARQNVAFNVGGLLIGKPYGAANLSSEYYGVDNRFRIVQRIAQRKYTESKYKSEAESTRRLEERVMTRFESEGAEALTTARKNMRKSLRNLTDLGGRLPELYLNTTSDRLWLSGHRTLFRLTDAGRVSNLGAPIPAGASSVNADVAFQVHESILSNYLDMRFNNQTFTNNDLAALAEELTGEKSEGLASEDPEDGGWSITFSGTRPIQFEFEDNAVAVTISGRRFSQGANRISAGLKIRIPMKIKNVEGKLKLVRDGEATIDYANPEKKNAKIVAFRSFLETKLNSAGKKKDEDSDGDGEGEEDEDQEIVGDNLEEDAVDQMAEVPKRNGIDLPDNLIPKDSVEFLKDRPMVDKLRLVELRMVDGWLYVGWNHVGDSQSYYAGVTDTPGIWQEFSVEPVPSQFPPPGAMPIDLTYEMQPAYEVVTPSVMEMQPIQSVPVEIGGALEY